MTDTLFNLNWYQKKIFRGIGIIEIHAVSSLQNVFDKNKPIPWRNPSGTLIPSIKYFNLVHKNNNKKGNTWFLSSKHFFSSVGKNVMKKRLRSFCQFWQYRLFHYRYLVSQHLLIALFGPECGLCKTIVLRTNGKYSLPVNVTTTDAAAKVKVSAKPKAEYQQIYFNFV